MEQLSSCYFCGGALDASLEAYPVVPPSLLPSAERQTEVVLCGTCKRKLDAVMETVVDAMGDRDPETDAFDGPGADIESTLGDDADLLRPVGDDAADTGEDSSDGAGSRAGDAGGVASDEGDAGVSEMQWGGEDDEGGSGEGHSDGSREAPTETPQSERGEGGGQHTDTDEGGSGNQRTYSSSRRAGYTGEDDETDANAGAPDHTLTRLENTKVMRLLQNREFPVDRDDFVTVAASAYEVSRRDCEKVIDLAVEHSLLREDDGQLHAGSRWS